MRAGAGLGEVDIAVKARQTAVVDRLGRVWPEGLEYVGFQRLRPQKHRQAGKGAKHEPPAPRLRASHDHALRHPVPDLIDGSIYNYEYV